MKKLLFALATAFLTLAAPAFAGTGFSGLSASGFTVPSTAFSFNVVINSVATSTTTVKAAAGAGKRIFISNIAYTSGTGAANSQNCNFVIQDGASNVMWNGVPSTTANIPFASIPPQTAANQSLVIAWVGQSGTSCGVTAATAYVNIQGWTE